MSLLTPMHEKTPSFVLLDDSVDLDDGGNVATPSPGSTVAPAPIMPLAQQSILNDTTAPASDDGVLKDLEFDSGSPGSDPCLPASMSSTAPPQSPPREAQQPPQQPLSVPQQQPQPKPAFEALKFGRMRLAGLIKQKAEAITTLVHTSAAVQPQPPQQQAPQQHTLAPQAGGAQQADAGGGQATMSSFSRFAATGLGAMARHTSSRLAQSAASAAEGFKRLAAGDPLIGICRGEPSVPQLVLACCTALVSGEGVRTGGIFKETPPAEAVDRLSGCVVGGRPALFPPSTSPHVIAAILKRWLLSLPEPLLTYRLLPDFISVAGELDKVELLLDQLPATNANVLRLLLELCYHINSHAADTEMDALALAEVLAPCVAWLPPSLRGPKALAPTKSAGGEDGATVAAAQEEPDAVATAAAHGYQGAGGDSSHVLLDAEESQAVVLVLEFLIAHCSRLYPMS